MYNTPTSPCRIEKSFKNFQFTVLKFSKRSFWWKLGQRTILAHARRLVMGSTGVSEPPAGARIYWRIAPINSSWNKKEIIYFLPLLSAVPWFHLKDVLSTPSTIHQIFDKGEFYFNSSRHYNSYYIDLFNNILYIK